MIKFFRHIRQRLLTENKFSKYLLYAVGEIILVVIGILIALQINNWNQDRINFKEEKRVIRDVTEEMAFNTFLETSGSTNMLAVIEAAERLLKLGTDPKVKLDTAQAFKDINRITMGWVSGRSTTIYDVLSGSGDFDLISSSALRKKLADLKANQEILNQFEELQNRFVDQQLRPYLNRSVDRSRVRSSLLGGELISTFHSSTFEPSLEQLIQNREFSNLLGDLIYFTDRITHTYGRIDIDIKDIDSIIALKYSSIKAKPYIPY